MMVFERRGRRCDGPRFSIGSKMSMLDNSTCRLAIFTASFQKLCGVNRDLESIYAHSLQICQGQRGQRRISPLTRKTESADKSLVAAAPWIPA